MSKVKGLFRELKWFKAIDWLFMTACTSAWLLLVVMLVGSITSGALWVVSFALAIFVIVGATITVNASKYAIQSNKATARYRRSR